MNYKSINSTNCVDTTTIIPNKPVTRFAVLGSFVSSFVNNCYSLHTGKHRLALRLIKNSRYQLNTYFKYV